MKAVEVTGLVRIVRKSDSDIKLRDLYVKVDDGEEKNVKFGAEIEIPVSAGSHTVHATNKLFKKHLVFEITASEKQPVFEVANTAGGCARAFLSLGYGIYRCELRRVE